MISSAEFKAWIEESVLQILDDYSSTPTFMEAGKVTIISWGHWDREDHIEEFSHIVHFELDEPTTDALRIFFLPKGNKRSNVNQPQLIFSLGSNKTLQINSSHTKNHKPDTLGVFTSLAQLGDIHIHDLIHNQFKAILKIN